VPSRQVNGILKEPTVDFARQVEVVARAQPPQPSG
jgi:hypothetical protein